MPVYHKLHINTLSERLTIPQLFNNPFSYQPNPLCIKAQSELKEIIARQPDWTTDLNKGKMMGVMIVKQSNGELGWLGAYSGQICDRADWDEFVPNIFDYLTPTGHFKTEEAQISLINKKIKEIAECKDFVDLQDELNLLIRTHKEEESALKEQQKADKIKRDQIRANCTNEETLQQLIKESQFQKAEIKRYKDKAKNEEDSLKAKIEQYKNNIDELKAERENRSIILQKWLFDQFVMLNANGEEKTLTDIFTGTPQGLPPAGAGECCAPKLLQYAYKHQLQPLCMMEWWWGESPKKEIRKDGQYYPACKNKCEPILRWMLQGLNVEHTNENTTSNTIEIIYEDEALIAVNKPHGMLSVPGKINAPSVIEILQRMKPGEKGLMSVHRLDMATAGILLIAKNKAAHQFIQAQFEEHTIRKRYEALLEGIVKDPANKIDYFWNGEKKEVGIIGLPICPDITDRPRQMVNFEYGKKAVTYYEICRYENGKTKVNFYPQTGRTHQLRVHSAHKDGLNTPIVGDELYGNKTDYLHLCAAEIIFKHPISKKEIRIKIKD